MSKLQKALRKLRTSEASVTTRKKQPRGDAPKPGKNLADKSGLVGSRARQQRTEEVDSTEATGLRESLSDIKLPVSFETLQESGLQPLDDSLERAGQEFRRIKRPILHTAFDEGSVGQENANVVMVSSALPKTGKTFCSIGLAISIARERDIGTILVDADVLKPNISRVLGLQDHPGLIDYLLDSSVEIDDILVATDLHDIVVVPAGQQHEEATELLASRRMEQFVASMSDRFRSRAIIVDTPPLLLTNEAHVLAEHMGQIVLVIEAGESTHESVLEALDLLNRDKPINAIINKARSKTFSGYSGDGYGYSYYAEE